MPDKEALSSFFRQYLNDRQELLDNSIQNLDENVDIIRLWPVRKKKLHQRLLEPMKRWFTTLKNIVRPPRNLKRYNKEKKRLLRAQSPALLSRYGFNLKASIGLLWFLNLLRILIIISFTTGFVVLLGYVILKLFHIIK